MIWLALVALGNLGGMMWLIRENRRLTQMTISKHTGDFSAMIRAERGFAKKKKEKEDISHSSWRNSDEASAP